MKDVTVALDRQWGSEIDRLDYVPEGGGAYHWVAETNRGQRWFVTVDDLATKPWLGSDCDSVFAGLLIAYRAALDLRRRAGLAFVVAPVPTLAGDVAVRLDVHHSVSVFPLVVGRAGCWGEPMGAGDRAQLVALLAELHRSTPSATAVSQGCLDVPGRERLEEALEELDLPWCGGPLSEPARQELATHADVLARWLSSFDELASRLGRSGLEPVITHGEPHPGNLIRTEGDSFSLLDWDTVGLDRPERDLWMLDDGSGSTSTAYHALTGRNVDPAALAYYRLLWALADLAAFTTQLRAPHRDNADTEKALRTIRRVLASEEPAPYGASATR